MMPTQYPYATADAIPDFSYDFDAQLASPSSNASTASPTGNGYSHASSTSYPESQFGSAYVPPVELFTHIDLPTTYDPNAHLLISSYGPYFNHPSVAQLPDANEWLSFAAPSDATGVHRQHRRISPSPNTATWQQAPISQSTYTPSQDFLGYEETAALQGGNCFVPITYTGFEGSPTSQTPSAASVTGHGITRAAAKSSSPYGRRPSVSSDTSRRDSSRVPRAADSASSKSRSRKGEPSQQTIRFVSVDPTSSSSQSTPSAAKTHSHPNIPQRIYQSASTACNDTTSFISYSTPYAPGVRLTDLLDSKWSVGDFEDLVLEDEPSHSATLRIWWPGEKNHWWASLPLKSHAKDGGPITRRQLGQRVAQGIRRVFQAALVETRGGNSSNPWQIVEQGPGIKFENLILVGLERASRGSWQPILRVN